MSKNDSYREFKRVISWKNLITYKTNDIIVIAVIIITIHSIYFRCGLLLISKEICYDIKHPDSFLNHGAWSIIYVHMHQGCQHPKAPEFRNGSWHWLDILSLKENNAKALTKSFDFIITLPGLIRLNHKLWKQCYTAWLQSQCEGILGKPCRRWKCNVKI
jgi:hypothetical protein